jgi:hypothetical protein
MDSIISNPADLRETLNILMYARHEAWRVATQIRNRQRYATPEERVEIDEIARLAASAERRMLALCNTLGTTNPQHPECDTCRRYSVTGGPGHEASSMCRSGSRAHCTCSACF